ncbi:MAG: DegV family protein [Eubacteriales bacterium]|nr:DegV family protein [Eubacteriales bacterium]
MKKIGLMIDTSADMPQKYIDQYDIAVVNFMVNFGDESFIAHEEISNEEFYKRIREGTVHPQTAQTPYQTLYDTMLKAAKECETLLYYTLSSKASGQFQTATLISRELMEENPELDIRIVDTMAFSHYITATVLYAIELIEAGESADDVVQKSLEYVAKWDACFVVDDLNYLLRGGRINKTTAVVGTMLDIKPALTVRDGMIETIAKIRGKKKVFSKMIDIIKHSEGFVADKTKFMIVHSNPEEIDKFTEAIAAEFGADKIKEVSELGPIIGTHTGPGVLAAIYYKENV